MPRLILEPSGEPVEVGDGDCRDALFARGVEFPCGGGGTCGRCRVRVLAGDADVDPADRTLLDADELADGWRLGCRLRPHGDCRVAVEGWTAPILTDERGFDFEPRTGTGIAVDVGTTTLVAQAVNLARGAVCGVRSALNPQAVHGADLVTRLAHQADDPGADLASPIRATIGTMVAELASGGSLTEVVLVGNTAMHHCFAGLPVAGLARYPFAPVEPGALTWNAREFGWACDAPVTFLANCGGFVGSDILAGILACGLDRGGPALLVDLGTNGEIALAHDGRIAVTSTAAGPAFEGARIGCGMRAAAGAIDRVRVDGGSLECRVIGGGRARGICGSGLVDAARAAVALGWLAEGGRIERNDGRIPLRDGLALDQADVRELQLAKGAIVAGVRMLLASADLGADDLDRIHVAGAFGNYVDCAAAAAIGLLPFNPARARPAGNTALLGAKLALFDRARFDAVLPRIDHRDLKSEPDFADAYVDGMAFPAG